MTKEELIKQLDEPNGPENLYKENDPKVLDEVIGLAVSAKEDSPEGLAAALSFLVRASHKKADRERIASKLDGNLFRKLLASDQAKVRKNCARLIGQMEETDLTRPLIKALQEETVRMVRPSMILALGALGTKEAQVFLASYQIEEAADPSQIKHRQAEIEALDQARATFQKLPSHRFIGLIDQMDLKLICSKGMEEALSNELIRESARQGLKPPFLIEKKEKGAVTLRLMNAKGALSVLESCRTFHKFLIPLGSVCSIFGLKKDPQKAAEMILSIVSKCYQGPDLYAFRLEMPVPVIGFSAGSATGSATGLAGDKNGSRTRQEQVKRMAQTLQNSSDGHLVNSPSHYEIQLRVTTTSSYLELDRYPDRRFAYRKAAIAASIHPANGAGLIQLARPFIKENALVYDPCCGSGTLLIERAMALGTPRPAKLLGTDISEKALSACRVNLKEAFALTSDPIYSSALIRKADLTGIRMKKEVDEVYANLPFGIRVGSHDNNLELYRKLADNLTQWLKEGGIAVLYTMEGRLLEAQLRRHPQLVLLRKASMEAGGLMPKVFILRKQSQAQEG